MKTREYQAVRDQIRPGDIIAFSGKGLVSWVIKWKTKSPVSHVGIVLRNAGRVKIIESTTLVTGEKDGVAIRPLSERIETFEGPVWWLKLRSDIRENLDAVRMYKFLMDQVGKEYDTWQAVMSALLWWTFESDKSMFCSELCCRGLEVGGVWSGNASEKTPADVVRLNLFDEPVQIWGEEREIF